jgi:hypothetical protein
LDPVANPELAMESCQNHGFDSSHHQRWWLHNWHPIGVTELTKLQVTWREQKNCTEDTASFWSYVVFA